MSRFVLWFTAAGILVNGVFRGSVPLMVLEAVAGATFAYLLRAETEEA